jgi:hypothetical protein
MPSACASVQLMQEGAPATLPDSNQPAADVDDTLASPTKEQWKAFRQQMSRWRSRTIATGKSGSGKAVGLTARSHLAEHRAGSGPGSTGPGSLLSRLKSALQEEPSIDELSQ